MDPTEKAARLVKVLKEEEWKALLAIEKICLSPGPSTAERIASESGMPIERVEFALNMLNSRNLILRSDSSWVINQLAIEALAIREYVKKNYLEALGRVIAKGKESDVYEAYGTKREVFALKFFKLGRISFRSVRRKRSVKRSEVKNWIATNYDAAKKEFTSLKKLEGHPSFPRVHSYNRNTVLMGYLKGVRLSTRPEVEPVVILNRIIDALRFAYSKGVVNGDMSEYNILTDGSNVWLIDWPQSVSRSHPNALELLRRDVSNILRFFKRVYSVERDLEDVLAYIMH